MRLKKILHKLLISYLFLVCVSGAISAIGLWFYLESGKVHELTHQIDSLQIEAQNVIGSDRQFLMYETINPTFYETGNSIYLTQHRQFFSNLANKMGFLQANKIATEFEISHQMDSVGIALAVYDSLYQVMIQKIKARGFKDYGAVGAMRKTVHQIEENQIISLTDVLTLRRHEKDYMIRNDLVYAQKLEAKIKVLTQQNIPEKSKLLLENYLAIFKNVVNYDQQIGIKSTVGLTLALKEQTAHLQQILLGIVQTTQHKREEMLAQVIETFAKIMFLIFVSVIICSYMIARNLTRPLRRLSATIDQLTETNFDGKITLIQTDSRDEVGKLTNNFNLMVHKLQQTIGELNKKQHVLEEKNVLLENTNRKLADSETALRETNMVKDKFFSIISHDLRGPFNTLRGFLDILSEHADGFSPEEIKHLTKDMSASVNNLYDLTNNLLQWALAQTNGMKVKLEQISIYELAEKNCVLFDQKALEKLINLENMTKKKTMVYADKNVVDFIFRNLISNALKFTEDGGSIRIICETFSQEVHITVIDSGIGISDKNLERLFKLDEKFTTKGTRSEKGSGLGLLLCKEFIEKIDGAICVHSEEGTGTEITFQLPIYKPEHPVFQQDKSTKKVLVS